MKIRTPIACCILSVLAISAMAQNQDPESWVVLTYSKVPADKMGEYDDAFSTTYAKVAQARITAGELEAFVQTRMIFPAGADAKYNYVTAAIYNHLPPLDRNRADVEKDFSRVGVQLSAFSEKLRGLGAVMVKRELWRGIEGLGNVDEGDLIRIDTKKVSSGSDYVRLERTVHKPFWAERIKEGALKGWALYYVSLPGGEDRPYSFATVQWFKDEQQMLGRPATPAGESWKIALPGKDPYEIQRETLAVSHTATSELGRVRLAVRAQPAKASAGGQ